MKMNEKQDVCVNMGYIGFLVISIIVILFQENIEPYWNVVNYYDEFFSLIVFGIYLFRADGRFKKLDFYMMCVLFLLLIFGIVGNVKTEINASVLIMGADAIGVLKPFLTMIAIQRTLNNDECQILIEKASKIFVLYIYAAVVFAVIAYLGNIDVFFASERFGIKAYRFICGNSGIFGYTVMAMLATINLYSGKKRKIIYSIAFWLGMVLVLLTTKGPQIIFVIICIMFLGVRMKKLRVYHFLPIVIIGMFFGKYQIENYLANPSSARFVLLKKGFEIARDHFPTGAGLGTFGSEMSRRYYSMIYDQYGISNIWGLSRSYSSFINDNYWPMIMGQFGFVVMFMLIWIFYRIFIQINEQCNRTIEQRHIFLALFITHMVGSLGSAYLSSAIGVITFFVIGVYINPSLKLTS